jgi:hypothetical protein
MTWNCKPGLTRALLIWSKHMRSRLHFRFCCIVPTSLHCHLAQHTSPLCVAGSPCGSEYYDVSLYNQALLRCHVLPLLNVGMRKSSPGGSPRRAPSSDISSGEQAWWTTCTLYSSKSNKKMKLLSILMSALAMLGFVSAAVGRQPCSNDYDLPTSAWLPKLTLSIRADPDGGVGNFCACEDGMSGLVSTWYGFWRIELSKLLVCVLQGIVPSHENNKIPLVSCTFISTTYVATNPSGSKFWGKSSAAYDNCQTCGRICSGFNGKSV